MTVRRTLEESRKRSPSRVLYTHSSPPFILDILSRLDESVFYAVRIPVVSSRMPLAQNKVNYCELLIPRSLYLQVLQTR